MTGRGSIGGIDRTASSAGSGARAGAVSPVSPRPERNHPADRPGPIEFCREARSTRIDLDRLEIFDRRKTKIPPGHWEAATTGCPGVYW